jgi:hypothetical protein
MLETQDFVAEKKEPQVLSHICRAWLKTAKAAGLVY